MMDTNTTRINQPGRRRSPMVFLLLRRAVRLRTRSKGHRLNPAALRSGPTNCMWTVIGKTVGPWRIG